MSFTQNEREKIQAAYAQKGVPAVPNSLRENVDGLVDDSAQPSLVSTSQHSAEDSAGSVTSWGRYAAMAACVCVGLAGGVLFAQWGLQPNESVQTNELAVTSVESEGVDLDLNDAATAADSTNSASLDVHETWVQRVADYQSLYTENTVATLSPTREADALRLLSEVNDAKPTRTGLPDLTEFGYTFARAQQLGFDGTPLVQLVYTKPGTAPLAFCYMAGDADVTREFKVADVHGLGTASWATDGQHFVLVGDEAAGVMGEIYRAVGVVF